jgi:hypothetical protein
MSAGTESPDWVFNGTSWNSIPGFSQQAEKFKAEEPPKRSERRSRSRSARAKPVNRRN